MISRSISICLVISPRNRHRCLTWILSTYMWYVCNMCSTCATDGLILHQNDIPVLLCYIERAISHVTKLSSIIVLGPVRLPVSRHDHPMTNIGSVSESLRQNGCLVRTRYLTSCRRRLNKSSQPPFSFS